MSEENPHVAVREWAAEFNKFSLEDAHVRELLRNTLYVKHHDGFLLQKNAFYIEKEFFGEKFLVLFGEHLKPDVHHMDEVSSYAMFEMKYPEREQEPDPEGCVCMEQMLAGDYDGECPVCDVPDGVDAEEWRAFLAWRHEKGITP